MSDYVRYTGKMKKVVTDDTEQYAKDLLNKSNKFELPDYYDSYLEYIIENRDEEFVLIEDVLYEIFELQEPNVEDDYFRAKINDNIIEFDTQFYNGGCGLSEALEYCVEKVK